MKKYTIEYQKPSMGNKVRQRGWSEGLSRYEAVKFVVECLDQDGKIVKILFDNKEVVPGHRESFIEIADLWSQIAVMENEIKPGAARRARKASNQSN